LHRTNLTTYLENLIGHELVHKIPSMFMRD